jgi:hypothetical protein
VVPYREPEAWVPSGGFGQFRTPAQQGLDAELAAQYKGEPAEDEEEGAEVATGDPPE